MGLYILENMTYFKEGRKGERVWAKVMVKVWNLGTELLMDSVFAFVQMNALNGADYTDTYACTNTFSLNLFQDRSHTKHKR